MAIDNLALLSPGCVRAIYTPQRIPQFKGNPLIEALPPTMSDEELLDALTMQPDFSPEQREWPTHERLQMLLSLQNFMIPLARHTELARALDSMIRAGYVGRVPLTAEHARIFQGIYEKQREGISFHQAADTRTPQLSTSLLGLSGMGKSTSVTRWLAHIPQVIYHETLNVYQVTHLHIEMPSDGSSMKGLAHAILHKLDELIPGSNYYKEYTAKGRTGADALMRAVARLMHTHLVGILICDEVQNIANSHKGAQTVMTELVSACNDLKVPIIFIGTNKAKKVLALDFRQSRRSCGNGIAPWTALAPATSATEVDEWSGFIEVLWTYQWVRNVTALNPHLLNVMYFYSCGVIDVAIKLFASAQARAMADGSEALSAELIADVYDKELQLLHPMLEALRSNDNEALAAYDDIAPILHQDAVESAARRLSGKVSPLFNVSMGKTVTSNRDDEAVTLPSKKSRTAIKKATTLPAEPSYDSRPADYRRAISEAKQNQSPILNHLLKLGHAKPLEALLNLA